MRIGTAYAHSSSSALLTEAQSRLRATQNELSSGKKVSAPSDDPVNASQIATTRSSLSMQTSFAANQSFLNGELRQLESTVGSVGDVLASARETLVAAGNGSYSDADRRSLAVALTSQRAQLVALGNTRNADGQYLFSGFQSGVTPFFTLGAGIAYAGDNGTRGVLVGPGLAIQSNSDGQGLFMSVPRGNGTFATGASAANLGSGKIDSGTVVNPAALTGSGYAIRFTSSTTLDIVNTTTNTVLSSQPYVPGQAISFDGMRVQVSGATANGDQFVITQGQTSSVFDAIDQAIAALNTNTFSDVDRAKISDGIRQAASTLEQGFNLALAKRAEIGGRMNALDQATNVSLDREFENTSTLSRLQDVDYTDAASRFAAQQTGLQAALAAYAQTSKMSLFDYIR